MLWLAEFFRMHLTLFEKRTRVNGRACGGLQCGTCTVRSCGIHFVQCVKNGRHLHHYVYGDLLSFRLNKVYCRGVRSGSHTSP